MLVETRSWLSGTGGGKRRLRISAAHDEWNHVGIALTAMDQGFLAEEGLTDVELVSIRTDEGMSLIDREKAQVQLIASGAVDIGVDPRSTFVLEARDRGEPIAVVAARRKNHAFILFGQKGMKDIEELRGQTLYQSEPGGANDVMMRQVLLDSGIDPATQVKIVYTNEPMHSGTERAIAFREGKHGPAILANTAQAPLLKEEGFPILADLYKIYPSRHDRITAANTNFVDEHPDLLKAFLVGYIRACRYVLKPENAAPFREMVMRAGFLQDDHERLNFDSLFDGWQTRGSTDLSLPREGIERIVMEEKQAEQISGKLKLDDYLRLEVLEETHAELAKRGM